MKTLLGPPEIRPNEPNEIREITQKIDRILKVILAADTRVAVTDEQGRVDLPSVEPRWSDTLEALSMRGDSIIKGKYDSVLILGGLGDTMHIMANLVQESLEKDELKTPNVVYLGGMRPLAGPYDKRALESLRTDTQWIETEADLASAIAAESHGVALDGMGFSPDSQTTYNNLGSRQQSISYLGSNDHELKIEVINGLPVEREGAARHTTKSVLEEYFQLYPEKQDLLLLVPAAHALRIAAEATTLMQKLHTKSTLKIHPILAVPDRLTGPALTAILMQTSEALKRLPQGTSINSVLGKIEQSHQLASLAEILRQDLTRLLLEAGPFDSLEIMSYKPTALLEMYLRAALGKPEERRADFSQLFPDKPELRGKVLDMLAGLGWERTQDTQLSELGLPNEFIFFSEGGTSVKISLQLALLDQENAPTPAVTIVAGAPWRKLKQAEDDHRSEMVRAAETLDIDVTDVADNEYELAKQFARTRVVYPDERVLPFSYGVTDRSLGNESSGQFELLGYDSNNKPIISMRVDRTEPKDGQYTTLGPDGTMQLLQQLAQSKLCVEKPEAICYSTSALYSPTRTVAEASCNASDVAVPIRVAQYARLSNDRNDKVVLSHAAAEFYALCRLVQSLVSK